MKKDFTISTADLQRMIIALIYAESGHIKADFPPEWTMKTEELLTDLNNACSAKNDYTLRVSITA